MSAVNQPRGIRNNNPGNIRIGDKWQGLAPNQTDPDFCVFVAPVWGIRAIAKILIGYDKRGWNTVKKIISRWAPASENNTKAYIAAVAQAVGVEPDEVLDVDATHVMLPLVKAIISHENGQCPYTDNAILEALRLAGVSDSPQVPLAKKLAPQALVAASTATGAIGSLAEPAKKAADGLSGLVGAPVIQHIVTGLLTIAGIATLAMMAKTWIDHKRGL